MRSGRWFFWMPRSRSKGSSQHPTFDRGEARRLDAEAARAGPTEASEKGPSAAPKPDGCGLPANGGIWRTVSMPRNRRRDAFMHLRAPKDHR